MLIAFSGLKGSGKDTAADYLVSKYKYKKETFAEPLKQALKHLFNLTDHNLYIDKETKLNEWYGTSTRQLMQFVGTELLRMQMSKLIPELEENIFVKNLENKIDSHTKIVISDLRMKNEYDMIKNKGGIVINIFRNGINEDEHSTEKNDLPHDYKIENNDDLNKFYENIDKLLEKLLSYQIIY